VNLSFTLTGFKPLTTNELYKYQRGRIRCSDKYNEMKDDVFWQMQSFTASINDFKRSFNKFEHSIEFTLAVYMPHDEFYTKKNMLNIRTLDIDNSIKGLVDSVMSVIDIDDGYIKTISASKIPCDAWSVGVSLKVLDK